MVGGVGWGCCSPVFFRAFRAPVLQTLQKQNCDGGGAGSPGGSLGRLRASSSPGVGWGWGRSCRAGVRRLCAEALKLCVLWSLPSLSVSAPVCFRWTLPGLLFLGDGRRLGRSGRLAGVGWAVSWSLGWGRRLRAGRRGAGCFLSCWGFFSLSGALCVSCCCWGFASPCWAGAGR